MIGIHSGVASRTAPPRREARRMPPLLEAEIGSDDGGVLVADSRREFGTAAQILSRVGAENRQRTRRGVFVGDLLDPDRSVDIAALEQKRRNLAERCDVRRRAD